MTDTIAHRGPDADGAWCDAGAGIALGHRRLSTIDLSPAGAQPMASASDIRSVTQFLRHGYIQAPASIYAEISKVRPGTMIQLRAGHAPRETVYWSAEAAARAGNADPMRGSMDEIVTALDATLRPIVKDAMVADVPLGAFLSGSIDSSFIVALMQAQSSRSVRTFTIGFDDPRYHEAGFAKEVAQHLGTDHMELMVRGEDALEFVTRLPEIYDEPMADSSQLPTLLVSRMTRKHVTLALSGDGGDELFGGYSWYRSGISSGRMASVPRALQRMVGSLLRRIPDPPPDFLARAIAGGAGERPANALR